MTVFEAARMHMVESQLRANKVTDERVLGAFGRIRRELFVPEPLRAVAYVDDDLPLGRGRYLMQPMVAGRLIQAVSPVRIDTALVVGAGIGYEAAVLSQLARAVVALEEDAELARLARAALVEENIASVSVVEGPLRSGYKPRAPYDVALFSGAVAEVPGDIIAQLADEGRLGAVVRTDASAVGRATLVTRTGGVIARRVIFDAATPLMPGFVPKPAFVF
jgi:protein-L-isoaspartate(D-aspartate) O-methyltransferase